MAVTVYNTKTQKEYVIHPQMAKDSAWMAARGLIVQDKPVPFKPADIIAAPVPNPAMDQDYQDYLAMKAKAAVSTEPTPAPVTKTVKK